jgi:hypothetical protein
VIDVLTLPLAIVFPASVQRMSQKENRASPLPGGTGQAYTTIFEFLAGRRKKNVGTIVITAPSVAVARIVYAAAVADAGRSAVAALRLPGLGDQQHAALYGRPALDETSRGGLGQEERRPLADPDLVCARSDSRRVKRSRSSPPTPSSRSGA